MKMDASVLGVYGITPSGAEAGRASTFANMHLAGQSRPASPSCGSKGHVVCSMPHSPDAVLLVSTY